MLLKMRIRDGYFSMSFAKFLFEHLRAAASEYFGYVNRHSTITKMGNRNESKHRLLCNFMIGLSVFCRYCKNGLIFLNVYLYGTQILCVRVRLHKDFNSFMTEETITETIPMTCTANQWTGFYMMETSVIKELIDHLFKYFLWFVLSNE